MYKRILTAVLVSALLCSSCGFETQTEAKKPVPYTPSSEKAQSAFTAASADFGVELLQRAVREYPGQNQLLSPFSAMAALAMAANGTGETAISSYEALLGGDLSLQDINGQFQTLLEEYRSSLDIADSIWFSHSVDPLPAYIKTVKQYYKADVKTADFSDPKTKKALNKWCSQATHGKIPEIATELTPDLTVLLLNALYFEMGWLEGFEDEGIEGDFTLSDGGISTAQYLQREEDYYIVGDNETGFLKYYDDPRFCLMALLPEEGLSTEEYLGSLSGGELLSLLENTRRTAVLVKLPEFTFDRKYSLLPIFRDMGLNPNDFSRMYEGGDAALISTIIQQTHIKLDKDGTTAAAVTEIAVASGGVVSQPQRPQVYLTRPFVFALVDCARGIPLFLGAIESPEA